jgi:hypothetical protein
MIHEEPYSHCRVQLQGSCTVRVLLQDKGVESASALVPADAYSWEILGKSKKSLGFQVEYVLQHKHKLTKALFACFDSDMY